MVRFFKTSSCGILMLGCAKATTFGPIAGRQVEEEFILYEDA